MWLLWRSIFFLSAREPVAEIGCPRVSLNSLSCWKLQNVCQDSTSFPFLMGSCSPESCQAVTQGRSGISGSSSEREADVKSQKLCLPIQKKAELNWVEQWVNCLSWLLVVLGHLVVLGWVQVRGYNRSECSLIFSLSFWILVFVWGHRLGVKW